MILDKIIEYKKCVETLITTLIRDFWVCDHREKIYDTHLERESGKQSTVLRQRDINFIGAERIVYVPRIKYTVSPNTKKAKQQLYTTQRSVSLHQVRGHARKSDNPKLAQILLAQRAGVYLPPKHTYVRPHVRGLGEKDENVVYRSKSLLQTIYGGSVNKFGKETDWFKFEKYVKTLISEKGLEAYHHSSNIQNDQGYDVLAIHKDTDTLFHIQCKYYAPDFPVGPSVVRELCGALKIYDQKGKGVIITTSYFTKDAEAEAELCDIEIITGNQLHQLDKIISDHVD